MDQKLRQTRRQRRIQMSEDHRLQVFELLGELGEKVDGRWRVRVLEEGVSGGLPFSTIRFTLRPAFEAAEVQYRLFCAESVARRAIQARK